MINFDPCRIVNLSLIFVFVSYVTCTFFVHFLIERKCRFAFSNKYKLYEVYISLPAKRRENALAKCARVVPMEDVSDKNLYTFTISSRSA